MKKIFRMYVEIPGTAAVFLAIWSALQSKGVFTLGDLLMVWFFFSCVSLVFVGMIKRSDRWGWFMGATWAVGTIVFVISSAISIATALFLMGVESATIMALIAVAATMVASIHLSHRHFLAREEHNGIKHEPVFFSFGKPIFNWDIDSL